MTVMMPVEALAPICVSCSDLDISVMQLAGLTDDGVSIVANALQCTHYQRCLKIKEMFDKEAKESRKD